MMKRFFRLTIITFILFVGISVVANVSGYSNTLLGEEASVLITTPKECNALFGDPNVAGDLAYYLQKILEVIKYLGIVLCIVLTIVDFTKAILGEEKDMYKPLAKTAFNRLCYAVVLFLLPAIIRTILTLLDVYGTCGIS